MAFQDILYDIDDSIATITLHRPDKLNAMTARMLVELRDAMRLACDDSGVRVIILTGAGRAFCSGADMGLLDHIGASGSEDDLVSQAAFDPGSPTDFQGPHSYFPAVPKPILCAINGVAVGLGFVYALYCDMRFASSEASVMTAFAKRGAVAEHGVSWLLPRLVGGSNAFDLLCSSRKVNATEAQHMGLFDRIVAPEQLMRATRDYAMILANECSPRSLAVMKRQLWSSALRSLADDVQAAKVEMDLSFHSEDFKEGVAHFIEKRPPRFTGR